MNVIEALEKFHPQWLTSYALRQITGLYDTQIIKELREIQEEGRLDTTWMIDKGNTRIWKLKDFKAPIPDEEKLEELEDNEAHCQECSGTHYFVNKYPHEEVPEYLWFEVICDNCATIQSTFQLDRDQVFMRLDEYE